MLTLPPEVQAKILRELNMDEKWKLFTMQEFSDILTSKCSWKKQPKVPLRVLKTFATACQIESGLYWCDELDRFFEITLNKTNGSLIIKGFSKVPLPQKNYVKEYSLTEFQQFVTRLKEMCVRLEGDVYMNNKQYITFQEDFMHKAPKNTLVPISEQYFVFKQGSFTYFISVNDPNSYKWSAFLKHGNQHLRLRADYMNFGSFQIWELNHWRIQYRYNFKMRCSYASKRKIINIKYNFY